MKQETYSIYQLVDPRDGVPRYVGYTRWIEERLQQHLTGEMSNHAKNKWIQELRQIHLAPVMQILEQIQGTKEQAMQRERDWIQRLKVKGTPLLNVSNTRTTPVVKITFYPGPGQEHKLNELIIQYWQRHHVMLNQNDILRYMVEQYTIDDLEEALRLEEE